MLEGMSITAGQTLGLFLLMAFGAVARYAKLFDADSVRRIADFVLLIVTPCLILTSFRKPFEPELLAGMGWAFLAAVLSHAAGAALARIFVHDPDEARRRAMRFSVVFSNAGFMGFPLEYALLGPDGVFFGSVYVTVFNICIWTYGVREIRGAGESGKFLKSLVNPGTVGIALGLPFFLLPVDLPGPVASAVEGIGGLNTPLSMLVIGFHLAGANFGAALKRPGTYTVFALRHVAVPAMVAAAVIPLAIAGLPGLSPVVALAAVIPAAAPVAASVAMFSVRYGRDPEYPVALVAASTVLSIATMPVAIGAAKALLESAGKLD